jgi:phosphoketolase
MPRARRPGKLHGMTETATAGPLSAEELARLDAYWRAANYLSIGQIYRRPARRGHVPRAPVPLAQLAERPDHLAALEHWMRSYRPEELFDDNGAPRRELTAQAPTGERRDRPLHARTGDLGVGVERRGLRARRRPRLRRRQPDARGALRGFIEEGTTTTPFDMLMLNDMDRFQLVMDVINRVPGLSERDWVGPF